MKNKIALFCFFLSGFAGLAYEIAWIRKASLVFGSTTWAFSTILAVFFGGLALGSWIFGRVGQGVQRPIRLYALLEIILALLALSTLKSFDFAESLFGAAYRAGVQPSLDGEGLVWLGAGGGLILARFGLVALALLPPTIVMGGTLPLFCRQFVTNSRRISGSIGFLYGINTLGAALGTAVTGFYLLPAIGVTATIVTAAGLNLAVGVAAYFLSFEKLSPVRGTPATSVSGQERVRPRLVGWIVPALFFAAGLVAIGAEVLWSRFLVLVVRNSIYTYTITLTVVLFGIVLGSLVLAKLRDFPAWKRISPATLFGACQILSALLIVAVMFQSAEFWRGLGEGLAPFFLLMLPAAILSGASFPLANRMVLDDLRFSSASVGRMTAFNTAGGIAGSLVAGFFLLPALGLDTGIRVLTLVGILTGGSAWIVIHGSSGRGFLKGSRLAFSLTGAAILTWWLIPLGTGTRLPVDFLGDRSGLVEFVEGHGATLAAVDVDGVLELQIDNLWQGRNVKGHQIMAAHIPALLQGSPADVLVIGVGVGQTAGRFLYHGLSSLDCVDIEREIFPFILRNFDAAWMRDDRVTLIPDDGRTFTAHTPRSYDIISVEVGQIFRPGIDVFYNREFYRDARARLKPGGLVAQFVPIGFLEKEQFRSVVATFLETFPQSVLWFNKQELLLIGSPDRRPVLDMGRLAAIQAASDGLNEDPADRLLAEDLAYSQWGGGRFHLVRPGALLGGFLADADMLKRMAGDAPIYTDDLPTLAYAASDARVEDHFEEPMARYLGDHLSPFSAVLSVEPAPEVMDLAVLTRRMNLRDLVATGLVAEAVGGQGSAPATQTLDLLRRSLELNPHSFLGQYNTGKLLLMNHRAEQAEPFLKEAAAMRPESGQARRDLGLAYISLNRPGEAMPHLTAAAELLPEDFAVFNYLGTALALSGRAKEAVGAFERALTLNPGDPGVISNLNRVRGSLGGNPPR